MRIGVLVFEIDDIKGKVFVNFGWNGFLNWIDVIKGKVFVNFGWNGFLNWYILSNFIS